LNFCSSKYSNSIFSTAIYIYNIEKTSFARLHFRRCHVNSCYSCWGFVLYENIFKIFYKYSFFGFS